MGKCFWNSPVPKLREQGAPPPDSSGRIAGKGFVEKKYFRFSLFLFLSMQSLIQIGSFFLQFVSSQNLKL